MSASSASKSILIGGGTGFIGRHLGNYLKSKGFMTKNVSRMPGLNNVSWSEIEQGLPKNVHAVVNAAGQNLMDFSKSWSPGFKMNIHNSRVFTTRTLAAAINGAAEKPRALVVVTGVGAYEPSDTARYDEASPVTGGDFFSRLVMEIEEAARECRPPVRVVTIRAGAVMGRDGGMIQNMVLPFFLGLGGPLGSGRQYLPWIHVEDLVRLIHYAIDNENVTGVLNGVAPQVITNEEFTKVMVVQSFARAMNRPALFPVPEFVLNALLNSERASIVTRGQHVQPRRVLEYGFQYKYDTIDKACAEFAYLFKK